MQTEITKRGLRRQLAAARAEGKRIAFVPTMGFLHEGHLQLVDKAREHGDVVVMSIFVNPLQFGPREDLAAYPRDLKRDTALARERGVDIVFAPTPEEMYGEGHPAVTVVAADLASRLDGQFRPGHFEGVLTIVAKLFNIVGPDAAVFGQKDFQQAMLVRRMCVDLDFGCNIIVAPTVRETDGLALSSRNVYLSAEERKRAVVLSQGLRSARAAYARGERDPKRLIGIARSVIEVEAEIELQYLALVDALTLDEPAQASDEDVMSLSAFVGKTRLIDNMTLGQP